MRSALARLTLLTVPALLLLWWLGPAWAGFVLGWAGLVYALTGSIGADEAEVRTQEQIGALRAELEDFRGKADVEIGNLAESVRHMERPNR